MKSTLEELYYGNIDPSSRRYSDSSDYENSIQILMENEEKLVKQLTNEQNTLYIKLSEAQTELNRITAVENFIDGFRLGAKIMMETLRDEESNFRDII